MNITGLLYCLEFIVEVQELRRLGLTEEEIEGYFEFDWGICNDLITSLIGQKKHDKH